MINEFDLTLEERVQVLDHLIEGILWSGALGTHERQVIAGHLYATLNAFERHPETVSSRVQVAITHLADGLAVLDGIPEPLRTVPRWYVPPPDPKP